MKFGVLSIVTFLLEAVCLVVIAITELSCWWKIQGTLLAFLLCVLIPAGLTLAFVGALKNEKPLKYIIVGFVLNALWFPLFAVMLAWALWISP